MGSVWGKKYLKCYCEFKNNLSNSFDYYLINPLHKYFFQVQLWQ